MRVHSVNTLRQGPARYYETENEALKKKKIILLSFSDHLLPGQPPSPTSPSLPTTPSLPNPPTPHPNPFLSFPFLFLRVFLAVCWPSALAPPPPPPKKKDCLRALLCVEIHTPHTHTHAHTHTLTHTQAHAHICNYPVCLSLPVSVCLCLFLSVCLSLSLSLKFEGPV